MRTFNPLGCPTTSAKIYSQEDWKLIQIAHAAPNLSSALDKWREMGLEMPENHVILTRIEAFKAQIKRKFLAWSQILALIRMSQHGGPL